MSKSRRDVIAKSIYGRVNVDSIGLNIGVWPPQTKLDSPAAIAKARETRPCHNACIAKERMPYRAHAIQGRRMPKPEYQLGVWGQR
ncbi:hypothetical protein, partial [Thalassobium sp. R2A62]|uniref:hypothetical protein n=1 Tax=Thalassobium sp. R2A62 TaxID=633131 RepID=UPI001CBF1CA0